MRPYTHPQPDPLRLMRYYRQFLLGRKRLWMARGRGHRCLRALIHYRVWIEEYLAAKACCYRAAAAVHEFFLTGDAKRVYRGHES